MALTQKIIKALKDDLLYECPSQFVTNLTDYYVDYLDYVRNGVNPTEYFEWNFTYILLVLESEGV